MPTRWDTFPIECRGGLVTNISPLQQGISNPGSARTLINFEPSIEGGYRRVQGYTQYDDDYVPPYGDPVVQASGQTGTTLNIANIYETPSDGDTFTIDGVAGTYTIDAAGVSFNSTNKTATLTLTTSLDSSPADKAAITFSNTTGLIEGVVYYDGSVIAYRGGSLWSSDGAGWTKINVPSYGTVLTAGGAQTGTSFDVDGLTSVPQVGDTFSVDGIELVYTVTALPTVTSGAATLTITPALASSPADNAAITFLSVDRSGGGKLRYDTLNFSGTQKIVCVDGQNKPFTYDGSTFVVLNDAPSDVISADHVAVFKNAVFFAEANYVAFTAPFDETNFNVASGAGVINITKDVTGMKVFRDQLIVFSTNHIVSIQGSTVSDFTVKPITHDVGCIRPDTIQEVGGDIAFLGPDGIRLLTATQRIGDFGLAVASRPIQDKVRDLVSSNTSFCSCVVRDKNQYRIFGYAAGTTRANAKGIIGVQFADQTSEGMAWAQLEGIKAYVADSTQEENEVIVFAGSDGFVYLMETGNTFGGNDISAFYDTPYFSVTDPRLRKTFYKLTTYIDPEGAVTGQVTPRLDFDEINTIQPEAIPLVSDSNAAAFYGSAVYGVSSYGGKLKYVFNHQIIGSGRTVSFQYLFEGTDPPFSLDAITLEYQNNDRQ